MRGWAELRDSGFLKQILNERVERALWQKRFDMVHDRVFEAWDWQWLLTMWRKNGLSIHPR